MKKLLALGICGALAMTAQAAVRTVSFDAIRGQSATVKIGPAVGGETNALVMAWGDAEGGATAEQWANHRFAALVLPGLQSGLPLVQLAFLRGKGVPFLGRQAVGKKILFPHKALVGQRAGKFVFFGLQRGSTLGKGLLQGGNAVIGRGQPLFCRITGVAKRFFRLFCLYNGLRQALLLVVGIGFTVLFTALLFHLEICLPSAFVVLPFVLKRLALLGNDAVLTLDGCAHVLHAFVQGFGPLALFLPSVQPPLQERYQCGGVHGGQGV